MSIKIKNDWAKALRIMQLNYLGGVNMVTVLKWEPFFWKFSTRVCDIAREYPDFNSKLSKVAVPFKNKMDNKEGYYFQYTFLGTKKELQEWFQKINDNGLKTKK